jgi:hypothetical protein
MEGSVRKPAAALGPGEALRSALRPTEQGVFEIVYTLLGDIAVCLGQGRQIRFDQQSPPNLPATRQQPHAGPSNPRSPQVFLSIE